MSNNYENVYGFDVGTGRMLSAFKKDSKINISSLRNAFIFVSQDDIAASELASTDLDYITQKDEDGEIQFNAILGDDAFVFSNLFNKTVQRPMRHGVISSSEIDAIDILTSMCKQLSGKEVTDGLCVFSVPAQAVDADLPPVEYHERVFTKIFKTIGFNNVTPLNEGASIVFSECADTNFTGIGCSFGSGLINIAFVYKGSPVLKFAVSRSGDWIDESVGKSLNMIPNRVASIKEKELDLNNPMTGNKKTRRVREALTYYYQSLIDYAIQTFIEEFKKNEDGADIDIEIPIVLSGGTSMPVGFRDLFEERFKQFKDFPYNISEIRMAKDPLTSTVKGCLIYAIWLSGEKTK